MNDFIENYWFVIGWFTAVMIYVGVYYLIAYGIKKRFRAKTNSRNKK